MGRPCNPLAPSHWTPQSITFRFGWGNAPDVDDLLDLLKSRKYRAQILGPKGSGKSTLLATLERLLRQQGLRVQSCRATANSRSHWKAAFQAAFQGPGHILLLDSAECMPPPLLRTLLRLCSLRRSGLILTLHQPLDPMKFPDYPVVALETDAATFVRLIREEVGAHLPPHWPHEELVEQLLQEHEGNAREVLARLYLLWEATPPTARPPLPHPPCEEPPE